MGKLLAFACLVCLFFSADLCGAEELERPLCTVQIASLGELSTRVDRAFGGSLPGQADSALKHYFAKLVHAPHLSGVDLDRPSWILVFDPAGRADPVAVVTDVSMPRTFLAELNQYMEQVATEGDVTQFGRVRHEFDLAAYRAASAEERKDVAKFSRKTTKPVYVAVRQRRAVIAGDSAVLNLALGMLPSLSRGTQKPGKTQVDAVAEIHLGLLAAALGPRLEGAAKRLLEVAGWPLPGALGTTTEAKTVDSWQNELSLLALLGRQVRSLTVELEVASKGILLKASAEAEPGTAIAGFLAAQEAAKPSAAGLLPRDAIAAGWLHLRNLDALVQLASDYRQKRAAIEDPGISEEGWAAFDSSLAAANGGLSGEMVFGAYAEREPLGMSFASAYALADSASVREIVRKSLSQDRALPLPLLRGLRISGEFEAGAETYRGVEIDKSAWKLNMADVPYAQKLFIGESPEGPAALGWLDDRAFIVTGPQCMDAAKQVIDRAKRGGANLVKSGAWRRAYARGPQQLNGLFFIDLRRHLILEKRFAAHSAGKKPPRIPRFRAIVSGSMIIEGGRIKASAYVPTRDFFTALGKM